MFQRKNRTVTPWFFGILAATAILTSNAFAETEIRYDSGGRRDPFVPLSGESNTIVTPSSSGVKLEGIIYDPGGRSMAILNGKTYQKGEVVGDATVVKILKDHVVITVEKEERTLRLREEEKA
ncbi:MAG: hypothetical protein V1882_03535 [Candidatus Omnitrophota bacterium]